MICTVGCEEMCVDLFWSNAIVAVLALIIIGILLMKIIYRVPKK